MGEAYLAQSFFSKPVYTYDGISYTSINSQTWATGQVFTRTVNVTGAIRVYLFGSPTLRNQGSGSYLYPCDGKKVDRGQSLSVADTQSMNSVTISINALGTVVQFTRDYYPNDTIVSANNFTAMIYLQS